MPPLRESMDRDHVEVHEGEFFTGGHLFPAVANNAIVLLRITVGVKELHASPFAIAEGKAYASLSRGDTFTVAGTAISFPNNNDNSSNIALTALKHTPTIDVAGTDIVTDLLIPGGTGPQSVGAAEKQDEERILMPNTEYVLAVQNKAGVAKDIFLGIAGYEHTDRT